MLPYYLLNEIEITCPNIENSPLNINLLKSSIYYYFQNKSFL